jgi:hypothetical protein
MPDPVALREQILSALTTAVGGEYGLPAPEDERDLPITIVEDQPETAAEDQYGYSVITMPVVVASGAIAATTDRDAMRAQANALLASIVQTVFADAPLGALVDGIQYTGGGIQTEVGKFVFAEAQFSIRYHTVRGNPFANE